MNCMIIYHGLWYVLHDIRGFRILKSKMNFDCVNLYVNFRKNQILRSLKKSIGYRQSFSIAYYNLYIEISRYKNIRIYNV